MREAIQCIDFIHGNTPVGTTEWARMTTMGILHYSLTVDRITALDCFAHRQSALSRSQ